VVRLAAYASTSESPGMRRTGRAGHGCRGARIAVAGSMPLTGGRRRIQPALGFGLGVLRHLIRHGRRYDASIRRRSRTSLFSPRPACGRSPGYRLVVDWHELWPHILEKNPVAVIHTVGKARETIPELRAEIYGDRPERPNGLAAIADHGLDGVVEAPGL
jgi:hypothetical protein